MDVNPYESPRETGYGSPTRATLPLWADVALCLTIAFGFWGLVFLAGWVMTRLP
jgi:hypothetical protein